MMLGRGYGAGYLDGVSASRSRGIAGDAVDPAGRRALAALVFFGACQWCRSCRQSLRGMGTRAAGALYRAARSRACAHKISSSLSFASLSAPLPSTGTGVESSACDAVREDCKVNKLLTARFHRHVSRLPFAALALLLEFALPIHHGIEQWSVAIKKLGGPSSRRSHTSPSKNQPIPCPHRCKPSPRPKMSNFVIPARTPGLPLFTQPFLVNIPPSVTTKRAKKESFIVYRMTLRSTRWERLPRNRLMSWERLVTVESLPLMATWAL